MKHVLIDFYKAIEQSSAGMLGAALAQDWDAVVRFEGACAVLIEQLRQHAQSVALPDDLRREKEQIMQRILHNDARIRDLTEPWLAQFEDGECAPRMVLH